MSAAADDLFTQLSSGFGVDRSPSARRVALAPVVPPAGQIGGHGARADGAAAVARFERRAALRPPALDLATLTDIAVGLAAAEDLWGPHVSHDPLSRTSVRLLASPVYEVWLLGWTPGQRVELHDHGGSNAAFVVVEGELDEVTMGRHGLATRHLHAGEIGTVAAGAVHDVLNRGVAVATSVHVYADPLTSMTYYDDHGRPRFRELVEPVPALVPPAAAARALHPGRGR